MFAAIALAVFAAAVVRGFTGFGFALAAVPLLGLALPPSQSVPLAVGLQVCVGLIDLPKAKRGCHWASLRWLIVGTLVGSPVGVLALAVAPPSAARLAIALICVVGTLLLVRGFRFGAPARRGEALGVGMASGLFNGLAAMPGPPVVAFYLATALSAAEVRASLLIFFLVASLSNAASLVAAGLVGPTLPVPLLFGLPLMLIGSALGERLFRGAGGHRHRSVSIALLGIVAVVSAAQAVLDLLWH
jgi:hypothetical protein